MLPGIALHLTSPRVALAVGAWVLLSAVSAAEGPVPAPVPAEASSGASPTPVTESVDELTSLYSQRVEPCSTGWAVYLDNDLLSFFNVDRDYSGGLAVTLSGRRATTYPLSLHHVLMGLNGLTRFRSFSEPEGSFQMHSVEFGVSSFTPENIAASEPIYDDHPYACLLFWANTRQSIIPERDITCISVFTVGLLGTGFCEAMQTAIHEALDQQVPQGWEHQISDGGEPTARYSVSVQKTLARDDDRVGLDHELKASLEADLGYTTDAGVGLAWRWGMIDTPWWSFNPHLAEYVNLGSPVAVRHEGGRREMYLWGGGSLWYRVYNAILQGKFRESEVTFSRSELNALIAEGWLGLTVELGAEFRASFVVRGRTNEIKGADRRNPVWGGLMLTRAF